MKKKRILGVIKIVVLVLMVIAGLSLILYPTISDFVNTLGYRRTVESYKKAVESLDSDTYNRYLTEAEEYNKRLAGKTLTPMELNAEDRKVYEQTLSINGIGVMAYIDIPLLNLTFPIYHGTSEAVLQKGIGHLEGSSLPVGGENTHCILSGHTGLPSSKLFTNIDKLKEGDVFYINVLSETLTYEVDQIEIVLPYQLAALTIEEGQDYCTLVTCTPYGVNTHRLLVRGHRIPTPEGNGGNSSGVLDFFGIGPGREFNKLLLIPAGIAIAAVFVIIGLALHYRVRKGKKDPKKAETEPQAENAEIPEETEIKDTDKTDDINKET